MLSCQQRVHACYSMLLVRGSGPKSLRIAVSVKPFIGTYSFRSYGNAGCGDGSSRRCPGSAAVPGKPSGRTIGRLLSRSTVTCTEWQETSVVKTSYKSAGHPFGMVV